MVHGLPRIIIGLIITGGDVSELPYAKKSLGQHWLTDEASLQAMCDAADVTAADTILEIGPGLGTLTELLTRRAGRVVAVEFDTDLAAGLASRVPAANLEVTHADILGFDFTSLPADYKIVANIPYYLTSNLIRVLSETPNRPSVAVLLVQKEVAERACAAAGNASLLSVTAQFYWHVGVGLVMPAELFTPSPKVDSQILLLERPASVRFPDVDVQRFFRLVKAGFAERRKKLRSSLSGGLNISKSDAESLLNNANIDPNLRAQALSLDDWHRLYLTYTDE